MVAVGRVEEHVPTIVKTLVQVHVKDVEDVVVHVLIAALQLVVVVVAVEMPTD